MEELVYTTKEVSEIIKSNVGYVYKLIDSGLLPAMKLGIRFNFHSLRHTHATLLMEAGANIKDIQKRLGHSKIATTIDTYSHVTENIKNNTVDIFEKMMSKNKMPTS